MKQHKHT